MTRSFPANWTTTTIGDVAELVNGRAFKPSEWSKTGLPIIRIQNLNRRDNAFNRYDGSVDDRHLIENGDLLFAWSGTPGTSFGAHVWPGPTAVLNQHIFRMRVSPEVAHVAFLKEAINQTLADQAAKAHGAAGLKHVTRGAFESTPIALPPLAEQARIVAVIEQLRCKANEALDHLDRSEDQNLRARTELAKASYDLSLLPPESRQPDDGRLVTVGTVIVSMTYGTTAKSQVEGAVPVLRMGNIQDGELDWTNLVYTSDAREIERFALEAGDVLFNRTNSPQLVGKTAMYRGEMPAIYAGYLIRVRCNERMLPEFLAICINSPAGREYCQQVKNDGVSQSNINATKLRAFELPCPSIEAQRWIVETVQSRMEGLREASTQVEAARERIVASRDAAVSEAVHGASGTHDRNDAPVRVTLERHVAEQSVPIERPRSVERKKIKENAVQDVGRILEEAAGPLPVDEVGRRYGIGFGTDTDFIEGFFAQVRELDREGRLETSPIYDETKRVVGRTFYLRKND